MKLLEVVGVTVAARLLVLELDFFCHRRHPPCGGNGVIPMSGIVSHGDDDCQNEPAMNPKFQGLRIMRIKLVRMLNPAFSLYLFRPLNANAAPARSGSGVLYPPTAHIDIHSDLS